MKPLRILAVLAAVQLLLVGGYLLFSSGEPDRPFLVEALDEPAPPLSVVRGDVSVPRPDGPHLVHFWATWCAPCLEELPALLAASEARGVPLLAVTDEPWPVVARHFRGEVPPAVVRDPSGEALRTWGVSGLPDTFVVRDGRVTARMGGPRPWQAPSGRAFLDALRRSP